MSFKTSFEAMGEGMIAAAEGNQIIAEEIAAAVKRLFAKLSFRAKPSQAAAK